MARAPRSPGSLFINLLGGFRVTGPPSTDMFFVERNKTRALLAMLAFEPTKALSRGKLTALLWSEQSEDVARHGLRQCLLDLRKALARMKVDVMRADGDQVGLDPARVVVDVVRFEECAGRATPETLQEAIGLYQGDLLEGFTVDERAFEEWLQPERERLRSRAVEALRKLLAHHARSKVTDAGVQVALRMLALEPFDETAHRTLMRFYADSGRRTAALRQYEACVEILARELGTEPEADTRELYRRLVAQRDPGTTTLPSTPRPRHPAPRAARGRHLDAATPSAPLVGRAAEREWLHGLCEAARGGRPQLGLVLGEAGIGKSRLIGDLTSNADERHPLILLGRGREGEDILPFAPWTEALRPALSVDVLDRLAPVTRQDLARLFPETANGPSVPPSGLEDGPRIFEAVAHLLRELAVGRRLVIVIEDLHWCDDMTVRLLRFLPRRLEGRSVLLLGTARQEEIRGGAGAALDALCHDPSCTVHTLGPLPRDEATELFQAFLAARESAPAEIAERMWRLSEGNPFVVIECARAVRDRGTATAPSSLGLPDQVRALTARGLRHLSDLAARMTDVAAVIGRDFDVAVLRQATRLTDLETADGVEELVRRRVLREVDGRFDFSHDRVREVAYARLLGPRRALLHRQVAEALEVIYAAELDSHFATIGAHYREAAVWDSASTYLARAGFRAWDRGAGREALACFEGALQAIARLPDTEERREVHVHLLVAANGAHAAIGSYEPGRPYLVLAQTLAATLSDRRWQARVAAALANSLRAGGAHYDALRLGRRALEIARETADSRLQLVAAYVLGATEHSVGNFRPSLAYLMPLLDDDAIGYDLAGPFLAMVDRLQGMRAVARHWIVLNYVELGEFDAGVRLVDEWLEETATVSEPLGTSRLMAYIARGRLLTAMGHFDAAVLAYDAGFAIYREDCQGPYYRSLSWGWGLASALAGRVSAGIQSLERDAASERKRGSVVFSEMLLLHLSRALIVANRLDDAARTATEALSWATEHGDLGAVAGAHGILGDVARLHVPAAHEEVERHLTEALRRAEVLEMRPLAARCHLHLAWLYERTGSPDRERHEAAAQVLLAQMGGPRSLDAAGVH